MKISLLSLFIITLIGCTNKDVAYYKSELASNKKKFHYIIDSVGNILEKENRIFKYGVEFTGKRFVEYSYITDSSQAYFKDAKLSISNKSQIEQYMYDLDLTYVWVYRDSVKFFFDGYGLTEIIIYRNKTEKKKLGGTQIGEDAFLYFNKLPN